MALSSEDVRRLKAIVGDDQVLTTAAETFTYECDGLTHLRGRPVAVVLPKCTAEVSAVVKVLADGGTPGRAPRRKSPDT